jgi:hypothetical protein
MLEHGDRLDETGRSVGKEIVHLRIFDRGKFFD